MKHLELFAGIGGFRRAFDILTKDGFANFDCIGFSEIDNKAVTTYKANYNIDEHEVEIGDIVKFTSNMKNIESLPDFDLLTGGFPCQTFSTLGKQKGFNDEDRGQMFFRIMDIVKVKKPRYIPLENVKNLIHHDKGNTFAIIKQVLEEEGYKVFHSIFNSVNFHIPQNRNRVLIFATRDKFVDSEYIEKVFNNENVMVFYNELVKHHHSCSTLNFENINEILEKVVNPKYFLSEKFKPTILVEELGNFKAKATINLKIAMTLTATMHKRHRASQDNYYSQDFIESNGVINHALDYTKDELVKLPIRAITPEEAFLLQGFPKEFVYNARNSKVSDTSLYKQAGNAVTVNTIYAVVAWLLSNGVMKEIC